jgi:hypothetical protein
MSFMMYTLARSAILAVLLSGVQVYASQVLAQPSAEPDEPPNKLKMFQPYPRDPGDERMPYWWRGQEFDGFVAMAWTHESESDGTGVEGPKFIYGFRGSGDELMAEVDGWLSIRHGGELDIYGVGAELVPILYYRPWFGLGPIINTGLEYRTESPHQGWGGFFGVGGEALLFVGRHWQVAVGAERDFGVGTHSRNMLHLSVGFGHPRLFPSRKRPSSDDI